MPMPDQLMVTVLGSIFSTVAGVAGGGFIALKVLEAKFAASEKLNEAKFIATEKLNEASDTAAVVLQDQKISVVTERVNAHDETFKRVLYKDVCDSCKGKSDDRHQEVCRRLELLESAFRTRFEDLIKALHSNRMASAK